MTPGTILLILAGLLTATTLFFTTRHLLRLRAERTRLNHIRASIAQWLTADMANPPDEVTELKPPTTPTNPTRPDPFGWFGSGPGNHFKSWIA
ncbi:hypothetical protein [Umezawaea tangerina]|uniref:Uncharacterized protein n=1 Tax=Umezawaea tangerina TaxID=84725 RepID=A0A2T0SP20_9PSEU|nr:hypothetical protein [Umezawaea tangerina]PRY35164.1 hypothetical protein CLV43_11482 [Umezawaea tangerina]